MSQLLFISCPKVRNQPYTNQKIVIVIVNCAQFVCVCMRACACTFELKAEKSGQTRSEWMSHDRERERDTEWKRGRSVQWIVGSCDVNSTDRPTLHTLLPINLLKWISNAALGASADFKLLLQTHTETKHTIFISSLALWGKCLGRESRCPGYAWKRHKI